MQLATGEILCVCFFPFFCRFSTTKMTNRSCLFATFGLANVEVAAEANNDNTFGPLEGIAKWLCGAFSLKGGKERRGRLGRWARGTSYSTTDIQYARITHTLVQTFSSILYH